MNELRISYNPFTKHYISDSQSHTIQIYNKGKQKSFNEYIRGIIIDNILYLRLYYPYNDIDNLSKDKLYQASFNLCNEYLKTILSCIKKHDNLIINDVKFNYTNDLFKDLLKTNYV